MKHICHNGTSLPGLVGHSIMAYWCIPGAVKDTQELAHCETLALCTQTHSFFLLLTEDT